MIRRLLVKLLPERIKWVIRVLIEPPIEKLPDSPDLFRYYRRLIKHPLLERKPGGWMYMEKFYPDYLTVGGASYAIHLHAEKFCKGRGVDIGAGLWPLPGSIPIDIERGPGRDFSIANIEDDSLDYIFSSHCLEHIKKWQRDLKEWISKLRRGGIVFLYLPHPECKIWGPGSPFVGSGHRWTPTPQIVKSFLQEVHCEIVQFDDGPDAMQSFYICARKRM
jgi:SAM-dependent methyltransferase